MKGGKLTDKQARFIVEYLVDLNGTQAAIRAGYSAKTAGWICQQLLTKTHVLEAIRQKQAEIAGKLEITVERVLKERARLAFFDPRKLLNPDGTPKPLNELDDDTAAAIAGLEISRDGTVIKYKITGKDGSLVALEKHLGLYEADNKQQARKDVMIRKADEFTDDELAAIAGLP